MTERLHFHFSLSCIGEGNGNPLQCSCLENPRDGGAWWAAISGAAQSRTRLKRLSSSSSSSRHYKCFRLSSDDVFVYVCVSVSLCVSIFFFTLFIYLWSCWVFATALRLSVAAANSSYSLLRCIGFSLQSTGSRTRGPQELRRVGTRAQAR